MGVDDGDGVEDTFDDHYYRGDFEEEW